MEEEKYEFDDSLKFKWQYLTDLTNAYKDFLYTGIFAKRRTPNEMAKYIELLSQARVIFWNTVYLKWPELKGKDLSTNSHEVKLL